MFISKFVLFNNCFMVRMSVNSYNSLNVNIFIEILNNFRGLH